MAFHAFDSVKYDKATDSLEVVGTSNRDLGDGAEIHVAVVDVKDEDRRCQDKVGDKVALKSWTVTFPDSPFRDGEEVLVAGMSKDDDVPVFVWAESFTIAPK